MGVQMCWVPSISLPWLKPPTCPTGSQCWARQGHWQWALRVACEAVPGSCCRSAPAVGCARRSCWMLAAPMSASTLR